MRRIHARLQTELGRAGAYLDGVRLCPHHPDSGFIGEVSALKGDCDCRKPKPGMLLIAAADMNIDLGRSWMVGDSSKDIGCAAAAGVTSVLVLTGEAGRDGGEDLFPDFVVSDFSQAVELILDGVPSLMKILAAELAEETGGVAVLNGGAQAKRSVQAVLRMMSRGNIREDASFDGDRPRVKTLDADALYARLFKDIGS